MARNDRENMLMQLGDYCANHSCENCPFKKWAEAHNRRCPEFLVIPELAHHVSQVLKCRRVRKEKREESL